MELPFRKQEDIISDICQLVSAEGYVITLCMILYEDFHLAFEVLDKLNTRGRLSIKESVFLIGLFLRNGQMGSFPEKPDDLIIYKKRTYELFDELHMCYTMPFFEKLAKSLEEKEKGSSLSYREEQKNVMGDASIIKEAITYSGTGVYDVQYLEFLEPKYKYDAEWLLNNKNFVFKEVDGIVRRIKECLHKKSQIITNLSLKENLDSITKKVKKKVRGKFNPDEYLDKIIPILDFYQYRTLFGAMNHSSDPEEQEANRIQGWENFYRGIIELFTIKKSDLKGYESAESFLNNFAFDPYLDIDDLSNLKTLEDFNILNSKPIIKIDKERYFVPITFLLFECVYETPFYWMSSDKSYKNQLSSNRGKASEEITYNFLSKIFGKETYRDVKVSSKKGENHTDIDVLCVLGNKALCVQVKSKKLTRLARQGNNDQLLKDFKGAVQDAYEQGLVCRNRILNKSARFIDESGSELKFKNQIDEVYVMGITSENYPSLTHQSYVLLDKKDSDQFPLFLSVFDLQLITHYLNDPYDFLYYVRQRIALMDYIRGNEEIQYLSYHLTNKLAKRPDADYIALDNDLALLIDKNYYGYIYGLKYEGDDKDVISKSWIKGDFQTLLNSVKLCSHPCITDVIFDIFDWDDFTRDKVVNLIKTKKAETKRDNQNHNFSLLPSSKDFAGLTYVSHSSSIPLLLERDMEGLTIARKYRQKSDKWIGLGSYNTSDDYEINMVAYHNYRWEYDNVLEEASLDALGVAKDQYDRMVLTSGQKIRRNDKCPCNSGKKYKVCCGK